MITRPGWCKHAIATTRGWTHERTGEILKRQTFSQAEVDEWMSAHMGAPINEAPPQPAPMIDESPVMHTHDNGVTHSHEGGHEPHEHEVDLNSMHLEGMTKRELEALGRENGIELDRRKNKQDLIEELTAHMNN